MMSVGEFGRWLPNELRREILSWMPQPQYELLYSRCIPPLHVCTFGSHQLSKCYRAALFEYSPLFNADDIVDTYLGKNFRLPSESQWLQWKAQYPNECY